MRQFGFNGLLEYALESVSSALAQLADGRTEQVQAITVALSAGDTRSIKQLVTASAFADGTDLLLLSELGDALSRLARALGETRGDKVAVYALSFLAECLRAVAELLISLDVALMAYNLFECSYHVSTLVREPALTAARRLRELSNPANRDQFAAAVWYLATEQLRHSLAVGGEWLQAVDAVELALTVVPESPVLQQQVYLPLEEVLRATKDTPVAELVAIIPVQAPPAVMPAERKDEFMHALLATQGVSVPSGPAEIPEAAAQAMRFLASVTAQTMVDDMRLRLTGVPDVRASLTWLDRSLRHRNLSSAVPLGQALVVDVDRTGLFALELVHEIGHAYALHGPIGWASTALRVSVQYLELLLLANEAPDEEPVTPRERISNHPEIVALAEQQIANAYRAMVVRATWTAWLEGVSVYLELLCDPADDPNEINMVHEAVRSLVDFPHDDLLGDAQAAQFEAFYSQALGRNSRLRHYAYATDENAAIYLSSYLLVRSIVSRWEATLGRPIVPAFAVKLLLSATRGGAGGAVMDLEAPLIDFQDSYRDRFLRWSKTLSDLDRETLEEFFVTVAKEETGRTFTWRNGRPELAIVPGDSETVAAYTEAKLAAIRLAWPSGGVAEGSWDEVYADFAPMIASLFDTACTLATLLPVGRDYARALLFDDTGRLAVCPRTYAGVQGAGADLSFPRYSIGSWVLPDGTADVHRLRQLLAVKGSSRLLVTRIIDLAGNSAKYEGRANMSYVCFHLPETDWIHLSFAYGATNIADDEVELRDLIISRINPPAFLVDEARTIGSLDYLVRRLQGCGVESSVANFAGQFDERRTAEQAGFAALASALGSTPAQIDAAMRRVLQNDVARADIANYLYRSGFRKQSSQLPGGSAALLSELAFAPDAVSGVKPHRGSST